MNKKFVSYLVILLICLTFVLPTFVASTFMTPQSIAYKNSKSEKADDELKNLVEFLEEKYGGDSIYMNTMCKVIGIGAGILFPPFIPLSSMLISFPVTALTTQGLQGVWSHTVNIAIFIAFAGVPIYIPPPPLFIILGYAGAVIGIRFD